MLNRLTKSAEVQARLDEEYFKINMEGHQMRLKLENTLKNCHQVGKGFAAFHNNSDPEMPRPLFLSSRTLHAEPVKILLAEHVGPSP